MEFEDAHTHDQFEIEVNEWIISGPEDEGWKEYPVMWPGINPPSGVQYSYVHLLRIQASLQRTNL